MSNRDTIITALKNATVAIVDELVDVTGWPERKVRDTLSDLKKIGIVTFERDDVSGKAAYRLAKNPPATKEISAKPTTEQSSAVAMPTDKECCNAAKVVAVTAGSHVAELRKEIELLKETVAQQRSMIDVKDYELNINESVIGGWFDLAKEFGCKSIPELRVFMEGMIDSAESEESTLLPVDGAYLVRVPKKAPRIFSKRSNAEAAALSSARQHGTVNVFALVPVGKAVRGANWEDAA